MLCGFARFESNFFAHVLSLTKLLAAVFFVLFRIFVLCYRRRKQWSNEQVLLLESVVREYLTDVESQILESRLPVTVEVKQDGEEVAVAHRRP